jgi:hypothetical protein
MLWNRGASVASREIFELLRPAPAGASAAERCGAGGSGRVTVRAVGLFFEGDRVMRFKVVDPRTGEYPDLRRIALTEDWARGLMYCDMEGFALEEDGTLLLLDECGAYREAPADRFVVEFEP